MAQRQTFELSNLRSADRILLVSSLLLVIDSFLPWQHRCVAGLCAGTSSAWGGTAGFLGILMGVCVLALLVYVVAGAAGAVGGLGSIGVRIGTLIAGGVVFFGLLKFLVSVFDHGAPFAWFGFVLLIVIAYGAYMRTQEPDMNRGVPPARGQ